MNLHEVLPSNLRQFSYDNYFGHSANEAIDLLCNARRKGINCNTPCGLIH